MPIASAQTCSNCKPEKCYSYNDCKPVNDKCEDGFCCDGECSNVSACNDEKINYIGDKLVDIMEKLDYINSKTSNVKLSIFGTEYLPNDNATIFLQLTYENNPLMNQSCFIDIWKPDKTILYDDSLMINLVNSDGLYYYDFTLPSDIGVYMVTAICTYPVVAFTKLIDEFSIVNGTDYANSYADTHVSDNIRHKLRETASSPRTLEAYYNFTDVNLSRDDLFALILTIEYDWYKAGLPGQAEEENLIIKFYNFSSNQCEDAEPQIILEPLELDNESIFTRTNTRDIANLSDFLLNGTITICIEDEIKNDTIRGHVQFDYISLQVIGLTNVSIENIRGSGEIHVGNLLNNISTSLNLIPKDVWSFSDRNLTYYNQTLIWIYLEDINNSQLGADDVWTYTTRTLSDYSGVWGYGTRTLTDYNQTDMWIYLNNVRDNHTVYFPFWNESFPIEMNITINATFNVTSNVTAESLWNYPSWIPGKTMYDVFKLVYELLLIILDESTNNLFDNL